MNPLIKTRLVVALCTVVMLPVCTQAANVETQAPTSLSETQLNDRLNNIEHRLQRAKLVVHKLKQEYVKAAEDRKAMEKAGVSEEDVQRIDRQFKHKIATMIDRAIKAINDA